MIQEPNLIAAIDIGTTKIVALVGRKMFNGTIEVVGIESVPSTGVKRGVVINIDETAEAITTAVQRLENRLHLRITDVYVGIAGMHIKSGSNKCYKFIDPPHEIRQSDIEHLYNENFKLSIDPNVQILHVIPQDFAIDNEPGNTKPVGMSGNRIEGNYHIVLGNKTSVRNIEKCIQRAGLRLNEMILEPLASSRAVITDDEKEAGVVLVDIGGGSTDVAVFYDGILRHTAVIPFGGNVVTSDIREGCAVRAKQAESLKIRFGSAMSDGEREDVVISIPSTQGWEPREVAVKSLSFIIQSRMEEIILEVVQEIDKSGCYEKLGAGIVLTGGGGMLRNLVPLIKLNTGLDVRIGNPTEYVGSSAEEGIDSPIMATGIGLLLMAMDKPVKKVVEQPSLFDDEPMVANNEINKEKEKQKAQRKEKNKQERQRREYITGNLFGSFKDSLAGLFDDKDSPM
jgi:cell division protein FtsA